MQVSGLPKSNPRVLKREVKQGEKENQYTDAFLTTFI
jgi:hypothetical protein